MAPAVRWAILLVVVLIAIAARMPSLGDGLWYDEVAAWRDYAARGVDIARTTYVDPANHVLQSMLTALSFDIFGPIVGGELAMRLPSLVASLVAVGLIAGLAGAIVRGGVAEDDALAPTSAHSAVAIAAVLAAACPVLALSGTEARGYAFMVAGAAGSTWAWIAWGRGHGRGPLAGYVAAMLAGAWAHPVTACVAVGHALVAVITALVQRRRCPLDGLIPPLLAGVVVVVAYLPILPDLLTVSRGFGRMSADQPSLLGPEGVHALLQLGGAWSAWAMPGGLLAVAGAAILLRDRRTRGPWLAALAGGGVLLAATLAGTWIYARFSLFLVPAALVAMGAAVVRLHAWRPAAAGAAMAVTLAAWTVDLSTRPVRQPLREAAGWVRADGAGPGDVHVIGIRGRVMETYTAGLEPTFSLDLGRDLDRELPAADPPRYVIELYPTRVDGSVHDALRRRGYAETVTLDGWIDWTHGDVRIWRRGG